MPLFFDILVILILVILILGACLKIVPQGSAFVVERLGRYNATWQPGVHFKLPVIDRVARKVLLKEQVSDFAPHPVLT